MFELVRLSFKDWLGPLAVFQCLVITCSLKSRGGSLVKISRKIMKWVNFVLLFLLDGKIIELTNLNAFVVRNYLKAVKKLNRQ